MSEFLQAFEREVAELVRLGEREIDRLGDTMETKARASAPDDPATAGSRARDSISTEPGRDARGYYVDFGSDWFVMRFLEFGTSRISAQPTLRPAIELAVAVWGR